MAELVSTIQTWQGLSTDAKPINPPKGSRFHETDTELVYIYSGSVWVMQHSAAVESFESRMDVSDYLEKIMGQLEVITEVLNDKL